MIWQRCCGEEALETKENREIINNITNNNTSKVTAATVTLRSAKNFK